MITLTLLHPIQSIPVQSWSFDQESVVRIGRSTENDVILYSAVVSRHHVELRRMDSHWEIVNLGANGTYLDGKRVTQIPIVNGMIIRLARSGPNIQIHLEKSHHSLAGETTLNQRTKPRTVGPSTVEQNINPKSATSGHSSNSQSLLTDLPTANLAQHQQNILSQKKTAPVESSSSLTTGSIACSHPRAKPGMLFCIDCGEPLQILHRIGEYQVVKTLRQDEVGFTYLACRHDQRLLLKTIGTQWFDCPEAIAQFQQQATRLLQFSHPGIPHFVDFFLEAGKPYLVMESIHGQDLYQRVASQGPFSRDQAIAILLQICDVLNYLHQQSPPFLHLALKPDHLIQSPSPATNQIIVAGFLSLILQTVTNWTTTSYTAPEQIKSYPTFSSSSDLFVFDRIQTENCLTPGSDLFALGPIVIYLLTGKEPGSFYAHRKQGFRLYPEDVPDLPPDLTAIIRKLTNLDPKERYATAQEVAAALRQVAL